MKIKTVSIEDDVAEVIRSCKLDGNNLIMQGQLSREL